MGFLSRISILFAIIGGFLIFPDERRLIRIPLFWIGLVFSALGFCAMSLGGATQPVGSEWFGLLLVFTSGACYGLYGVAVRYTMEGTRPWIAFPIIASYTSVVLVALMFWKGNPAVLLNLTPGPLFILFFSSLVGIAVGHTFYYISIERLGVAITSGTQFLAPVLTGLWAWIFFNEHLTLIQWIGGVILLGGSGLLLSTQSKMDPQTLTTRQAAIEASTPE
jgi:drug/metabolite transporter (DMT)-like permease